MLEKLRNLGKDMRSYYESEGTIKERLTEVSVWYYYNMAADKDDDYLLKFFASKCFVDEGYSKYFK